MRSRFYPVILLVALAGCTEQKPSTGNLIVIPGRGIPKVAEVTMSLAEIRRTVRDLKVTTSPPVGFPWRKDSILDPRRLPWQKPEHIHAESRSLGLSINVCGEHDPVKSLVFFSDPLPFSNASNACFTGQLACGISFGDHRTVSRAEVVAAFGEPSSHVPGLFEGLEEARRLIESGVSLSAGSSNQSENMWFPSNGIAFFLSSNKVYAFQISAKVKQLEPSK